MRIEADQWRGCIQVFDSEDRDITNDCSWVDTRLGRARVVLRDENGRAYLREEDEIADAFLDDCYITVRWPPPDDLLALLQT